MAITKSQKMLKILRSSMNMDSLTHEERIQCELKLKLTEKLDHILFTEWDPCGVSLLRGFDCTNEYHRYLPTIVNMVFSGASFTELSDKLMELEDWILGDLNIRRRCDVIAVMVSHYGPHASENRFIPVINTATPEAAYQSVLDLVTQTRLDAYEGKWRNVRVGYEKVAAICSDHLPEHHELKGVCFNNLGMAYSKTGEFGKAQEMYAKALPELEHGVQADYKNFMSCINNTINNLEHQRKFACTASYYEWMLRIYVDVDGWEYETPWKAKKRLDAAGNTKRPAPKLHPKRIPVERDDRTKIQQIFYID